MTFVKGQKRHPKAGRQPGQVSKVKEDFKTILRDQDFSPGETMIYICNEALKLYEDRKKHKNLIAAVDALKLAAKTANDISQYVYPRLRSVEHTGEVGIKTFADFVRAGLQRPPALPESAPIEIDVTPKKEKTKKDV